MPAPARSVFLKSQDLRFAFEQVVDGIEPFRAGLEVSDKVEREDGREFGGEAKLLLVMYLLISHCYLRWEKGTYSVPREVSWMSDGTGPSRLLNDKSLISAHNLSQVWGLTYKSGSREKYRNQSLSVLVQ
jgi:hypothetical protein